MSINLRQVTQGTAIPIIMRADRFPMRSTFYGVLVSVERVYAEMLSELGFHHVECVPIRKRNPKKALIEFDVRARWRRPRPTPFYCGGQSRLACR